MREPTLKRVLRRAVRAQALGGRAPTVVEAVRCAAGVYGAAPTCPLSLLARVRNYTPGDLDDAVLRTRELVRIPAMRGSIYLIPVDLAPHALALTPLRSVEHYAALAGIDVRSYPPLADRIEQALAEKPRTAAEIRVALGGKAPDSTGLTALLRRMSHEGRIVRARVRGGARSQSYEYARMADWIDLPDRRPSHADALRALTLLWLRANGPATQADLAWWAGTALREAKDALAAIGARPVKVKGNAGELYATEELLDDLAKTPAADGAVHLLPCWDSYLMAHTDRSRYLDDAHRPHVVDRMGNTTNVVLRAGRSRRPRNDSRRCMRSIPSKRSSIRRRSRRAGRTLSAHRSGRARRNRSADSDPSI
ncbi:MAG TPA: winged helix DNA-binding domain-containing protein [Anaerolineae bacterium]|nr:winged helix DNA-binding domain-containing protein [Anaerolineae bacterium]